jgi:hypothetical protein
MADGKANRLNIVTIVAVALPAFGLQSVAHEVLGHAVTAWLTGAKVILISSTAMQTQGGGRLVPASGPLANLLFGIAACIVLRRMRRFGPGRLFLWLFAFANLFIGTGYILYSGLIDFGDAAYVIAGLQPAWVYRLILVLSGGLGYRYSIRLAAKDLLGLVRSGSVPPADVNRIVQPSWIAGSALYLVASLFNPVSRSLILYDGLSSAFGVALGFALLAKIVPRELQRSPASDHPGELATGELRFSAAWLAFGSIFTILFVISMGRGIRLH